VYAEPKGRPDFGPGGPVVSRKHDFFKTQRWAAAGAFGKPPGPKGQGLPIDFSGRKARSGRPPAGWTVFGAGAVEKKKKNSIGTPFFAAGQADEVADTLGGQAARPGGSEKQKTGLGRKKKARSIGFRLGGAVLPQLVQAGGAGCTGKTGRCRLSRRRKYGGGGGKGHPGWPICEFGGIFFFVPDREVVGESGGQRGRGRGGGNRRGENLRGVGVGVSWGSYFLPRFAEKKGSPGGSLSGPVVCFFFGGENWDNRKGRARGKGGGGKEKRDVKEGGAIREGTSKAGGRSKAQMSG